MSNKFNTEQIINSLDGIQRAEPAPFLYTRLRGRMAKEDAGSVMHLFKVITSPAFSLAIACVFIVVNGYFLMNNLNEDTVIDENNQMVAAEYVQLPENPYVTPTENP
jgi:hypothetical protein